MLVTPVHRMGIDLLHTASVAIFLSQMGFILGYYIPLMADRDKYKTSADGDTFISDFLFSDDSYRSYMTFFVSLQLVSCALLAWRWRCLKRQGRRGFETWVGGWCDHSVDRNILYAEMVLIGFTWVGWIVLCSDYSGADGTSNVHTGGVATFISGSFIYYLLMVVYVFSRATSVNRWIMGVLFCVTFIPFVTSCVTGFVFINMALHRWHDAWVYEHVSYVLFCICHILLFCIDGWLGSKDTGGYVPVTEPPPPEAGSEFDPPSHSLFERVRIQFNAEPSYPHTTDSLAVSRLLCL
jgi:hypothetical protein